MTMALLDFFKNKTVLQHEYVPHKDWLVKYTQKYINSLAQNEVSVTGRNIRCWRQGQYYAIPTIQCETETIKTQIDDFMTFAEEHQRQRFHGIHIECGIAEFLSSEITHLLSKALGKRNIILPHEVVKVIN